MYTNHFIRTDGKSLDFLGRDYLIHISVYDNGTIMCQGSANYYWNADHLPILLNDVGSVTTGIKQSPNGSPLQKNQTKSQRRC